MTFAIDMIDEVCRNDKIGMGLEYIRLAPGFVREVVDVYETWERRRAVPMKISLQTLQSRGASAGYSNTEGPEAQ